MHIDDDAEFDREQERDWREDYPEGDDEERGDMDLRDDDDDYDMAFEQQREREAFDEEAGDV